MKADLLAMIPHWENSERAAGIEYAGHHWLTTPLALQDIRDVLLVGAVPGEKWVTADRRIVPMTFVGLQSLWQAITAHGAQIYQHRLEMEQQVAGSWRHLCLAGRKGACNGSSKRNCGRGNQDSSPVSVTAAVLSGVSVADVIQWLTVLYLVLQIAYLLAKWRRESRIAERQACVHDK
ncbi:DUF4376 domain-containing protein [Laribacter hongkongensis]|uniref:DUF4376 domain-containing protein n=1 Tax=Laribacter hongkongensis TaxID=168471 RepID=UPI001D0C443D|nr:DUF4376 domain-containing protein [Laribacter hongkongensis]